MSDDFLKYTLFTCTEALRRKESSLSEDVWEHLLQLKSILPLNENLRKENSELCSVYQTLLDTLLNSNLLDEYELAGFKTEMVDLIFLRAFHVKSFFALVSFVKGLDPCRKLDAVLSLINKFLDKGSFEEMCQDQCCVSMQEVNARSAWKPIWEQLITLIVSMPSRIYNVNTVKNQVVFEMTKFSLVMSNSLLSVLNCVHNSLKLEKNMSLEFQSLLLGRLCITGYGQAIFRNVTPRLLSHHEDFLWRKVSQKLILGVPEKYIEPVLSSLLANVTWYGFVEWFIGNGGMENSTIKYLLSKKYILVRFFRTPDILFKCIGYYSASERHELFLTIFQNVLDVWSKKGAMKHQSDLQHYYLSCAVMICGAFLPSVQFGPQKALWLKYLMDGVQTHIESSSVNIRTQGMVVGQSISTILDPSGPKMNFEFEETKDTKRLTNLLKIPPKPDDYLHDVHIEKGITEQPEPYTTNVSESLNEKDLDSDDDLEPYDQSNDLLLQNERVPVYIQDVISGLTDHSQPNVSRMCLQMADKIVRSQPTYASRVCEELAKILLHLEDTFAADDFTLSRFKAMVAVLVVAPEKTATYLTDQFYKPNYSVRQRLDILEVLASASQELSQCKSVQSEIPQEKSTVAYTEHWSQIIQKRIDSKTRRFGSLKKRTEPTVNPFSSVAGTFFFPLLRSFNTPQSFLDLLGDDSYLLGRLIYTLGVICNSATNAPVFRHMAKTMLELIWTIRYHSDVFIRQALLFALCMVLVNTPSFILFEDFQTEISELQLWLHDILEKDSNKECQTWARQILTLLFKSVDVSSHD